jgi:hypothetical protein
MNPRLTPLILLFCWSCQTTPPAAAVVDPSCSTPEGAGAFSTCLTPHQTPDYYVAQGNKYFDALDRSMPADSTPTYSELVARWEWPPWLLLTGYTRVQMEGTDKLVKSQAPAVVSHRDCRFFAVQPFARCRVSFDYDKRGNGKGCAIYEEFTFNDAGEMTFIEAWSDLPGYLPMADKNDLWAEGPAVHRLSTRVPGLGSPSGKIALDGSAMLAATQTDPELADFVARANDFWPSWLAENEKAGPDYFKVGCGW